MSKLTVSVESLEDGEIASEHERTPEEAELNDEIIIDRIIENEQNESAQRIQSPEPAQRRRSSRNERRNVQRQRNYASASQLHNINTSWHQNGNGGNNGQRPLRPPPSESVIFGMPPPSIPPLIPPNQDIARLQNLVHHSRDFRNSYPPGIRLPTFHYFPDPPPPLMSVPIQRPLMHPQHRQIQNPPGIQNPQIQNPPQYQNPASFDNYEEVSMEMGSPDEPQPEHDPFAKPPIQIPLEAVTSTPSGAPESSTTTTSATPETEESLRQYLLSQLGSKRTAEEKPQKSAKRSRRGSSQKSENQKKNQEMEKMFEDTTPIEPKPPTPKIAIGKIDGISTKIAPKSSILAQNSTQNASNLSILTRNSPKPSIFASKSSSLSPSTPDLSFFTQNSQKTTTNNPFLAQRPISTGPFSTQIAGTTQNPAPTAGNARNSAETRQTPSPMTFGASIAATWPPNAPIFGQNATPVAPKASMAPTPAQNAPNLAQNAPNVAPVTPAVSAASATPITPIASNSSILAQNPSIPAQNAQIPAQNTPILAQNAPILGQNPSVPAPNTPNSAPAAPESPQLTKEERKAELERRRDELTARTAQHMQKLTEAKKSDQLASSMAARAAELAKQAEEMCQVAKEMRLKSMEEAKSVKEQLAKDSSEKAKIQKELEDMVLSEFDDIGLDDFPVIFFSTIKHDPSRGAPLEKEPKEELDNTIVENGAPMTPMAQNPPISAQNSTQNAPNSSILAQNAPNQSIFTQHPAPEVISENSARIGAAGDVISDEMEQEEEDLDGVEYEEEEEDVENDVFESEGAESQIQENQIQKDVNGVVVVVQENGRHDDVITAEKEDDEQSVEGEDEYEEPEVVESLTTSQSQLQKAPEAVIASATSSPKKSTLEQLLRARLLNKRAEITPDSSTRSPENTSPSSSSSQSDRVEECRSVLHKMCKFELNGKCERPRDCTFLHLHNINDKKQQTQLLEGLFREIFQYKEADIEAAIAQTMHFLPEFREFEKLMDQFFKVVIHKTPDYKNRLFTFFAHRR